MVGIDAAQTVEMQRHRGVIDEPLEEFAHEIDVEGADARTGEFAAKDEPWAAREVDHRARQRLVERHVGVTVAGKAALVAQGLGKRLTEGDADVLDRVVVVDVRVAFGANLEVDEPVPGHLLEHVVEKGHAGGEFGATAAVEIERHAHAGLEGVALDDGGTAHRRFGHGRTKKREGGNVCMIPLGVSSVATLIPRKRRMDDRYWSPTVKRLTPYVPGEQPRIPDLIKLNTNEHPHGPSPRVLAAIQAELDERLRLYPDPEATALRHELAQRHGVEIDQVFVGNGSDEVLAFAFQALLGHAGPIWFPDATYSFYPVYCTLYGLPHETVPLTDDFRLSVPAFLPRGERAAGGVVFANPNAPTGIALELDEVERIVAGNPQCVVLVDEAYVDFGAQSAIPLIERYSNLLVVQTFSKSRALAGLRVGYAIGQAPLIEALRRVKDSFNSYPLDRLAQVGALASLQDEAHFEAMRLDVIATRASLARGLEALGFEVLPSQANFVFARHRERSGAELAQSLRERKVLVRRFDQPRIADFLRITVGTREQCARLLEALAEILGG